MKCKSSFHMWDFLKKYKFVFWGLLLLVLVLLVFFSHAKSSSPTAADFARMRAEEYEGIFASMYPIDNFAETDFETYLGRTVIKAQYTIQTLPEMSKYLKKAFASGNNITHIYMGLDSAQIWDACNREDAKLQRQLQENLLVFAQAHPEVNFEILLPFVSLDDWMQKDEQERITIRESYFHLLSVLDDHTNIKAYFMGAAHWLIANPGNYQGGNADMVNEVIAQKIMMYTFCDGDYVITSINAPTLFEMLDELIAKEEESPHAYPDLSEWCVVFFGDSIIGNYIGSFSIPGVVKGLSGADTYNCAIGGSSAVFDVEKNGTSSGIQAFLAQDTALEGTEHFNEELRAYLGKNHEGQKLCFVLNYGLNDYFIGCAPDDDENPYDGTSSYGGALRADVKALRKAYPDAYIILAAPNYISYFGHGQDIQSEHGGRLTDYVEAAQKVAEELELPFLNSYIKLGINADNCDDYLADEVHLNEEGRFLLAEHIIECIVSLN